MMTNGPASGTGSDRPAVSVIVPCGEEREAQELASVLAPVARRPGDQLIVADNSLEGIDERPLLAIGARVVRATGERSSYHARNAAAATATGEWLLFTDADCVPAPDILDAYFEPAPAPAVAARSGEVVADLGSGASLAERWAASRRILDQDAALRLPGGPAGATANLLVRRAAWQRAGGFCEGVRSGADFEFCWRLADLGWRVERAPGAVVRHRHRTTPSGIWRQLSRYGAGNRWQNRRRPGSTPRPRLVAPLAQALGGAVLAAVTLRGAVATMRLLDAVAVAANATGYLRSNAAEPFPPAPGADASARTIAIVTDYYPAVSETFVAAEASGLAGLGWRVVVEAMKRPRHPALGLEPRHAGYVQDSGAGTRLAALAGLIARHPYRCARDLAFRRRFDAEERQGLRVLAPTIARMRAIGVDRIHAHFCAVGCVSALRAGRVLGVPVSVVGHGHELFVEPRTIPAKLAAADLAIAPCEYTARCMRELAAGTVEAVHVVIMGVDPNRFRRSRPHPGTRAVVAVGRLVEKKGFGVLIEAAAVLATRDAIDRLVIVGDGPLEDDLRGLIAARGLGDLVRLAGPLDPAGVRGELEQADLLAMPCVIAPDGDRDAMPVVVKEAMAMELPVVASDEVGLPEVVRPEWGTLVPPGDAPALAEAIAAVLERPVAERIRMGAAARAHVARELTVERQAQALDALLRRGAGNGGHNPGGE